MQLCAAVCNCVLFVCCCVQLCAAVCCLCVVVCCLYVVVWNCTQTAHSCTQLHTTAHKTAHNCTQQHTIAQQYVSIEMRCTTHIFDFVFETAKQNSASIDRKQDLNVLYQVCVFRADWKNKIADLAFDWLRHFDFSSETAERNSKKLDRKQDLKVFYQVFCFSGQSIKTRWLPRSLIGRDIFDFSSETAERNSTKLERKQDLNVLYQGCVLRKDHKIKLPPQHLIR